MMFMGAAFRGAMTTEIEAMNNTRPLTEFEVKRLESVIENEARCNAKGVRFGEYDTEQEGRYILGLGQYRAGYEAGQI
jgi:hypothetical protein